MKVYSIVIFLFLVELTAFAQQTDLIQPDSVKKALEALAVEGSIEVDGKLSESAWQKVKPSPRFTQVDPYQGADPNFNTKIKVLYNQKYLYIGVICLDSLGKSAIRATDFKRDFNFQTHDLVTLCFDGFNDERNAMSIAVNPYGVQRDYLSFDALYYDIEWDGLWRTRTSRTDTGWIAEIAIPWKTLRYPKTIQATQDWGFQLYRNRRLTNEITAFSEFPRAFGAARMDYAGKLKNLQPPPPSLNIQIKPYILRAYNRYQGPNPDRPSENTDLKVGGELKWAISPKDVLDVTLNTDFAQADVDRQVNNTSRFSVFFPERRQFFLENASLFGINVGPSSGGSGEVLRIQPFFSRRIGLNSDGSPIPLDFGGRFVHRSATQNYGGMMIRQRARDASPATHYFVGRFSQNLGKQSRIGGLSTVKHNKTNTNISGTIDAFVRINKAHSINTLISYAGTNRGGKQGFAGIAQYEYSTNKWQAWWTQSVISQNYNPEVGFISRSNVISTTPGIIRFFRGEKLPFKKWLRAFEPSVSAQFYHQASTGQLVERQYRFWPIYLNFQGGGYLGYGLNAQFQLLTNPFKPLGITIPKGDYNYIQQSLLFSTDGSKKLSTNGNLHWGTYFNGKLSTLNLNLQFSPIPHISLGARFNRNHFQEVGQDQINRTVDLYGLEGRFAINPRLQLSAFFQHNSSSDLYNVNVRFSWEYQPLSFIYIVYNRQDFELDALNRQLENQVIGKISFLRQF
ncbi:MAG: carbohydrate binding family 9 domain-containing protein [Maribacter sp.]|nr:carbohydrate binding family 9 domain-containing protein [Maribacter sp.]